MKEGESSFSLGAESHFKVTESGRANKNSCWRRRSYEWTKSCPNAQKLKMRCDILLEQLPKVSMTFLKALLAENCTLDGLEASTSRQNASKIPTSDFLSPLEKDTCVLPSVKAVSNFLTLSERSNVKMFSKTIQADTPSAMSEGQLFLQLAPSVGLKAVERANTTLEDFCRSYFMFHGMDVQNPQHLFKHLPILSFVEAFIYQLDEENEDQIQLLNRNKASDSLYSTSTLARDSEDLANVQELLDIKAGNKQRIDTSTSGLGIDPFERLIRVLDTRGLLTDRIKSEFQSGVEYWRIERILCESTVEGHRINLEDVIKAIKLKSFDYRVLNLLLYSLTGRQVNEVHFEFLAVSELLVEISDDLFDYEDDVLKNSFNVLRMLMQFYGPTVAPEILAKLISEQELLYQHLLDRLEPDLARQYQDRCKEATSEGGGSKHQFGLWTIPPLILDERRFRAEIHSRSLL